MIVVHHLNNSRSQRMLWLLEELGLEYTIQPWQRDKKTMLAPPELRAIHPLGKSPIVVDGDLVLAESGAIIETLVERYDAGNTLVPPRDSAAFQRWRYWLHYAEGSAMPPLLLKLIFDKIRTAPMPFFAKPFARAIADKANAGFIGPQLTLHLDFMEAALANSEWFVGDRFSAADIQLSFPLEAAASRAGLDHNRPRLLHWLQRIHARPAYQRALQRGGPYDYA